MALNPASLILIAHGFNFNLWHYGPTADASATVGGVGYFNAYANVMNIGDWIIMSGVGTVSANFIVTNISGGVVTTGAGPTMAAMGAGEPPALYEPPEPSTFGDTEKGLEAVAEVYAKPGIEDPTVPKKVAAPPAPYTYGTNVPDTSVPVAAAMAAAAAAAAAAGPEDPPEEEEPPAEPPAEPPPVEEASPPPA